jgi:hypothetical protein
MSLKEIAYGAFGFFMAGSTGYAAIHISMALASRLGWDAGWWGNSVGGLAFTIAALVLVHGKPN